MRRLLVASAGITLGFLCCEAAHAEIGKASASPGEWFLGFNIGGGASWGPGKQAYADVDFNDSSYQGQTVLDDGAFYAGGLEIGHVFADPALPLDRVELNLDFRKMTASLHRNPADATLLVLDPETLGGGIGLGGDDVSVSAEDDESDIEARLAFKTALIDGDSAFLLASLEPFYRFQHSKGRTDMASANEDSSVTRSDKVDADYYGLQLAFELEHPLSQTMSLIARASAGAYHVTNDIEAKVEGFGQVAGSVNEADDSDSSWGGRFGGALGVKVPLHYAGASLSLVATVDYMSDVATVHHVEDVTGSVPDTTRADFDDTFDIGGRVGLVFPLR